MRKANSEPRPEKVESVGTLVQKLSGAKSAVFTGNSGLTVEEVTQLRAQLFKEQVDFRVVKNTLAVRALKKVGMEGLDEWFKGPTAVAMAMQDALAPCRVLAKFMKDHDKLTIKGGWLEGRKLSLQDVKVLASLPSREVLLARLLGTFQYPARGMVQVLVGPLRKLVYALSAIQSAKAKAA